MADAKTFPKGSTWDQTDPDNPQPLIYPVCGDCGEAYVYTRCLSFTTGGYIWAWLKPAKVPRGCRHNGSAKIHEPHQGGDNAVLP